MITLPLRPAALMPFFWPRRRVLKRLDLAVLDDAVALAGLHGAAVPGAHRGVLVPGVAQTLTCSSNSFSPRRVPPPFLERKLRAFIGLARIEGAEHEAHDVAGRGRLQDHRVAARLQGLGIHRAQRLLDGDVRCLARVNRLTSLAVRVTQPEPTAVFGAGGHREVDVGRLLVAKHPIGIGNRFKGRAVDEEAGRLKPGLALSSMLWAATWARNSGSMAAVVLAKVLEALKTCLPTPA